MCYLSSIKAELKGLEAKGLSAEEAERQSRWMIEAREILLLGGWR